MAELINLRAVRKQAKRLDESKRAAENRVSFGRTKAERVLDQTRTLNARHALDAHRIERENER